MEALIILMLFIVLAVAAQRWGSDSREDVNSGEWRQRWLRGSFV